jgi:hypothetical protein
MYIPLVAKTVAGIAAVRATVRDRRLLGVNFISTPPKMCVALLLFKLSFNLSDREDGNFA